MQEFGQNAENGDEGQKSAEPGRTHGLIESPENHRSGYVAIVGRPNVGKSTLMNALMGQKLSIVSRKPQTTRHRVLGILSGEDYQAIFLDTPGLIQPRYRLQEAMMHALEEAIQEADLLLLMVDATTDTLDDRIVERVANQRAILVLNKMDLIPHERALPIVESYVNLRAFEAVVPISALTGYNVEALKKETVALLPAGPALYPHDIISEHPERFFIAEIIREKIFENFRQEIPYSTQVEIIAYDENPEKKDVIHADIVVERDSQKGILIGKKGAALRKIGTEARLDIEHFLDRPVFLKLFVKVRGDWRNQEGFLRSFGYRT